MRRNDCREWQTTPADADSANEPRTRPDDNPNTHRMRARTLARVFASDDALQWRFGFSPYRPLVAHDFPL
jgi:hypothetical protein